MEYIAESKSFELMIIAESKSFELMIANRYLEKYRPSIIHPARQESWHR